MFEKHHFALWFDALLNDFFLSCRGCGFKTRIDDDCHHYRKIKTVTFLFLVRAKKNFVSNIPIIQNEKYANFTIEMVFVGSKHRNQ